MSKIPFAPAVALIAGLISVSPASAAVVSQQIQHIHSATAMAMHRAHLEKALKDIAAAEAAGKAGHVEKAEHAAAAAMKEIHSAMAHHKHHSHLHQHHHSHLTAALADLKKAEQQFKTGHVGTAEKDLAKAAVQVEQSLAHHRNNHQIVAKK